MPEFKVKKGGSGDKHMQKMVNEERERVLHECGEYSREGKGVCMCERACR